LVNNIGGGGGAKSTIGIWKFNLRSQVRKRRKIGLNQFLIYIHPFLLLSPQFLFLPFFNSVAKKLVLGRENIGVGEALTPLTPPSYVCGCVPVGVPFQSHIFKPICIIYLTTLKLTKCIRQKRMWDVSIRINMNS
jgi:hypothetical protein